METLQTLAILSTLLSALFAYLGLWGFEDERLQPLALSFLILAFTLCFAWLSLAPL